MADKENKTPIEELESFPGLKFNDTVHHGSLLWIMKQIILDQDKRIIDLELTVDTLQRQLDRK